jgi:transketolase
MANVRLRNTFDVDTARRRCKTYRKRILDISQQVSALHIAPAFSCLEIADVIYHGLMRRGADGGFQDTFLMSKGHGCMSQYVILEDIGILSDVDLAQYCKPNGRLGAHPDYGVPGIMASTGSLGHGMGIACGMAYADKLMGDDRRTFVVLSDGEFQEGSTWEGIMMSANLKLDNLVGFLDLNDFSGMDRMSVTHPAFYPVVEKVKAFGWETQEVNGHDAEAVFHAAQHMHSGKPLLIVCRTVKGRGVSYMEHVPIWHYRSPNKQEYEQATRELAEIAS